MGDYYDFGSEVADMLKLVYINTLIYGITPPRDSFETDEVDFGMFKLKLVKSINISDFDVTFIDDKSNTVTNWYHAWIHSIF